MEGTEKILCDAKHCPDNYDGVCGTDMSTPFEVNEEGRCKTWARYYALNSKSLVRMYA